MQKGSGIMICKLWHRWFYWKQDDMFTCKIIKDFSLLEGEHSRRILKHRIVCAKCKKEIPPGKGWS
jgi:hypothetical protein